MEIGIAISSPDISPSTIEPDKISNNSRNSNKSMTSSNGGVIGCFLFSDLNTPLSQSVAKIKSFLCSFNLFEVRSCFITRIVIEKTMELGNCDSLEILKFRANGRIQLFERKLIIVYTGKYKCLTYFSINI